MSYTNNNPYLLNIIPLFNVSDPSNGYSGTVSNTTLGGMINQTTHTVSADILQPYTESGKITVNGGLVVNGTIGVTGAVSVAGSLNVNGYTIGPDANGSTTVSGSNYTIATGTTGLALHAPTSATTISTPLISFQTAVGSVLEIDALGRVLYKGDGVSSNVNRFTISNSILSVDRMGIGIGTLSTLSSVFDIYKGDAYFDENIRVNSNVYCKSVIYPSDARLKKSIVPLTGALSTLCELNGVHYTMNGAPELGFLAQDVQRVLPDAVHETNGVLGIDYMRIIPLLVEAVKELVLYRS